jgi:hypothetical protein
VGVTDDTGGLATVQFWTIMVMVDSGEPALPALGETGGKILMRIVDGY